MTGKTHKTSMYRVAKIRNNKMVCQNVINLLCSFMLPNMTYGEYPGVF